MTIDREEPENPIELDSLGEVVEQSPTRVRLKVKRDRVVPVCKELFDRMPVKDIDIEEVPIEDIIRELFDRKSVPERPRV